ncbi:MAG: hypothetical protein M1820_003272 [Bogoriella megaspora]|nr:MAG: hypothetical protein M1820_003272 [Bogoriella megaspora]
MSANDSSKGARAFADQFKLAKVDDRTYQSIAPPFSVKGRTQAYGGHVFAQAAWAAAQTVQLGFVIHNISGYFILPGDAEIPFTYHIKQVRNGRSYCLRSVSVIQARDKGPCFTCTISFKRPEPNRLEIHSPSNPHQRFSSVLGSRHPSSFPKAPGMDVPWYKRLAREGLVDAFPGLHTREVNMEAWNRDKEMWKKRQLYFYSVIGKMPSVEDEANLHVIAHLYACDHNALFLVPNLLGKGGEVDAMASLQISVVMQGGVGDWDMGSKGNERWFCQESGVSWIGDGRALHESKIWSPEGRLVATTRQEGMVRLNKDAEETVVGVPKL